MKKLLLFLFLTISLNSFSQVNFPTNSNGEVEYSKVIEVTGDADMIYGKAKMFIGESFISASDVIKIDDDKNHQLIVKGVIINTKKGMYPVEFRCQIQFSVYVKDNKVKYVLKPLNLKSQMYSFSGNPLNKYEGYITEKPKNGVVVSKTNWDSFQSELSNDFNKYLISFENYLKLNNDF